MRKILYSSTLFFAVTSCTPAHIIYPEYGKNVKTAKLVIVRPHSKNLRFVPSIFGFDGMDIAKLDNNAKKEINIPTGNHKFFVRSNQADRPLKYSRNINENDKLCFMVKVNVQAIIDSQMMMGLFYFTNAFVMEEVKEELCKD